LMKLEEAKFKLQALADMPVGANSEPDAMAEALETLLAGVREIVGGLEPPLVVVVVSGGLVRYTTGSPGVRCVVVDYDVEGSAEHVTRMPPVWDGDAGGLAIVTEFEPEASLRKWAYKVSKECL
jgi:hypothetical protein